MDTTDRRRFPVHLIHIHPLVRESNGYSECYYCMPSSLYVTVSPMKPNHLIHHLILMSFTLPGQTLVILACIYDVFTVKLSIILKHKLSKVGCNQNAAPVSTCLGDTVLYTDSDYNVSVTSN